MSAERVIDARPLPATTFGASSLAWWGTIAFMLSEFVTLVILFISAFYLRRNFEQWPPVPADPPALTAATINLVLIMLLIVPMTLAARAARRFNFGAVRWALVAATLLGLACTIVRGFELADLNVGWDSNAYGSVLWTTLGFHALLLVVDLFETSILTLFAWIVPDKVALMPDIEDAMLYQYFLSFMNLPVYAVVFLLPRAG